MKLSINTPEPIKKVGLVDGEEIVLICSNCEKACCCLKVTQPNAKKNGVPHIWRARARCGFGCKRPDGSPEISFPVTINGLARIGPCYKNSGDEIIFTTSITNIQDEKDSIGEVTTYYTKGK